MAYTLNANITYQHIQKAANILNNVAHKTPVFTSSYFNNITKAQVYFKCENLQKVGAFKFRGAYFAIHNLSKEQKEKGVVAFSAGNHAQAVALASQLLGTLATIVMPSDAPAVKLVATREYGANVILYDRVNEDREAIAKKLVEQDGKTLIPPFDHVDIIAGQGTAAKELFEEVGALDYLFVPIGGGGLIAGSTIAGAYLSPQCQVIGVEPENGNDAQQSLEKNEIVKIEVPSTIADGARTQQIGKLVFPILQKYVKEIYTVSDEELTQQMRLLAERMKIIVEPTGCLGAAAILKYKNQMAGKKIGVILSGGNVDLKLYS